MVTFLFYFVQLNSLVLIAAILSKKDLRQANFFLCGMIAAALLAQWVRLLIINGTIEQFPYLLRVPFATSLLVPALFYLYALALTQPDFKWEKKYFIHFAPFGFGLLWNGVFLLSGRAEFWKGPNPLPWEGYTRTLISFFVFSGYLVTTLLQIKKYRLLIPQYFSQLQKVRLTWLKTLLIIFAFPWILGLVDVVTGPFFRVEKWMVPLVNFILVLIGFFGWRQSALFSGEPAIGKELEPLSATTKIPRPSFFTQEELAERKAQLEKTVAEKKPYLEPELHLVDLAKVLGLKSYQVSELLNRGLGLTFYDYINRLRIEEAKRKLLDPGFSHYNILGIATDCGFNSKSVFNDTFRKFTGLTPSTFRQSGTAKIFPKPPTGVTENSRGL